jgi:hypothetical protein
LPAGDSVDREILSWVFDSVAAEERPDPVFAIAFFIDLPFTDVFFAGRSFADMPFVDRSFFAVLRPGGGSTRPSVSRKSRSHALSQLSLLAIVLPCSITRQNGVTDAGFAPRASSSNAAYAESVNRLSERQPGKPRRERRRRVIGAYRPVQLA